MEVKLAGDFEKTYVMCDGGRYCADAPAAFRRTYTLALPRSMLLLGLEPDDKI